MTARHASSLRAALAFHEPAAVSELPLLAERNGEASSVPFDENDLHQVRGGEKSDDLHMLGQSSVVVLVSDKNVGRCRGDLRTAKPRLVVQSPV
jgi:hypothetical protein